jgi:hypothetical protein
MTVNDLIIARLKALGELIPELDGGVVDPTECPLSPPCLVVEDWLGSGPRAATRERISATEYKVTRSFLLALVVEELCDAASFDDSKKIVGIRAARPWMETLPAFFLARPLLQLDGVALDNIIDVSPMSDNGVDFITWSKRVYVAVQYQINITSITDAGV